MKFLLTRFKYLAISTALAACAISFSTKAEAFDDNFAVLSSVLLSGDKAHGGQASYFASDPAYGPSYGYQGFLLQPGDKPQFASVGVNMPALNPGIGPHNFLYLKGLEYVDFNYEVANAGPSVDPGLSFVIQTSDGFLHSTNSKVKSTLYNTVNGFNVWHYKADTTQFTPSFAKDSLAVETITVRYSATTSNAEPIYWFFPSIKTSGGYLTPDVFNFQTISDDKFKN